MEVGEGVNMNWENDSSLRGGGSELHHLNSPWQFCSPVKSCLSDNLNPSRGLKRHAWMSQSLLATDPVTVHC